MTDKQVVKSLTPRVLVADGDELSLKSCNMILESHSIDVITTGDGKEALEMCRNQDFDLIITDLKTTEPEGVELLRQARQSRPGAEVIVMTDYASVPTAIDAIRSGAYDYLQKPFSPDEFMLVVNNALQKSRLVRENHMLREQLERRYGMESIIGNSEVMRKVYKRSRQAAQGSAPVLLIGEVGAGKELIARAIHYNSSRNLRQFVVADCSSLPPSMIEPELFGRVKGTHTGLASTKAGLLECAHEGTIFIDEISVIPLDVQSKLIDFIKTGRFQPKDGEQIVEADVRILSATKIDPAKLIKEEKLIPDLLDVYGDARIEIPPLRERKEDVPLLVMYFLEQFCEEFGKDIKGFTHEAMDNLMKYDWPGNVRGLKNAVEQAVLLAMEERIHPEDLPQHFSQHVGDREPGFSVPRTNDELKKVKSRLSRRIERQFVIEALRRNNWNVTRAAGETGLARPNFHALMRRYDITAPKSTD